MGLKKELYDMMVARPSFTLKDVYEIFPGKKQEAIRSTLNSSIKKAEGLFERLSTGVYRCIIKQE